MGWNDRMDHPEVYGDKYAREVTIPPMKPIIDRDPGDEVDEEDYDG